MIKTFQGTIYSWNCDHMGHMNVQFYVAKFDQATWNLIAQIGLTSSYFRQTNKGMVALEQNIKYKKELIPGDNIFIESKIIEIKEKTIRFVHVMINLETNEIAAETELTGLHMDTILRKACPFPDFVHQKVENYMSN